VEKKKRTIFILIIVLIGIFNLVKNGKCINYTYVWYFNVDKTTYYNDEFIYVNTSYDLDYDPEETSYIQLQIRDPDKDWNILWNSSKYHEKGVQIFKEWYIQITDIQLPFNNTFNNFAIVFYYYLTPHYEDFKEIRYVSAIKRNITCELIDFKQNINYGDILQFKARFYCSENNSNLANHLIIVKIVSNNVIHYNNNFTTNSSGKIEIIIPTFENITIGRYNIKFEVIGTKFYDDSTFEYQLYVGSILYKESSIDGTNSKDQDNLYSNILPIIFSILSISLLAFIIIYHSNIKNAKQKDLADLTFKF